MNSLAHGTAAATLWRTARSRLAESLASASARLRAERAIDAIPPELPVRQLLLECDLAGDRLDFAVVCDAAAPAAARLPFCATVERVAAHAEWAAGNAAHAATFTHEVWLEFDVTRDTATRPAPPAGFIALPRELVSDAASIARLAALLAADGDLHEARARWPAWQAVFTHALAPLLARQPRQHIRYLGRMDSRGARGIRYHLGPVTADAVAAWRALPPEVLPALALADWLVLGLDLDPSGAGPRWGLEIVFNSSSRHHQRWRPVIDALVASRLLPVDTASAIDAWTGATCETDAPDAWLPALLGGPGAIYHARTINHIKLVFTPGAAVTAKIYLANDRRWLQPDLATAS